MLILPTERAARVHSPLMKAFENHRFTCDFNIVFKIVERVTAFSRDSDPVTVSLKFALDA
jgi:hypothetical protein